MPRTNKKILGSICYEDAYDMLLRDPELYERALLNKDDLQPEAQKALRAIERLHQTSSQYTTSDKFPLLAMIGCVQG